MISIPGSPGWTDDRFQWFGWEFQAASSGPHFTRRLIRRCIQYVTRCEILSEQSSCFSLWTRVGSVLVVAQQLAVLRVEEEGVTRISEFVY